MILDKARSSFVKPEATLLDIWLDKPFWAQVAQT